MLGGIHDAGSGGILYRVIVLPAVFVVAWYIMVSSKMDPCKNWKKWLADWQPIAGLGKKESGVGR